MFYSIDFQNAINSIKMLGRIISNRNFMPKLNSISQMSVIFYLLKTPILRYISNFMQLKPLLIDIFQPESLPVSLPEIVQSYFKIPV